MQYIKLIFKVAEVEEYGTQVKIGANNTNTDYEIYMNSSSTITSSYSNGLVTFKFKQGTEEKIVFYDLTEIKYHVYKDYQIVETEADKTITITIEIKKYNINFG